jgi:SAM-dependent methyltransferase
MSSFAHRLPARLPWPLPALLSWAAAWAAWQLALHAGAAPAAALACGIACGTLLAARCSGAWRRTIAALGFPLLALAAGAAQGLPGWIWLLPALPLLLLYPLGAWRDAPFFPTPRGALAGLAEALAGAPPRCVLDAGCGLGHGLRALHGQWPQAALHGIERSPLLRAAAALCCRFAQVRGGDIWAADWRGFDLVYLFQRPESMPRAWAKALHEMRPGAWLVSLEFEVPGAVPHAVLDDGDGDSGRRRTVWAYRVPSSTERAASR